MFSIRQTGEGITFKIFVLPRSSKNMVSGVHGDALKVKLTAPPVDNSANKMCIKFLAKLLKTSKSSLEIVSGHTSRTKTILVRAPEGGDEALKIRKIIESLTAG